MRCVIRFPAGRATFSRRPEGAVRPPAVRAGGESTAGHGSKRTSTNSYTKLPVPAASENSET